MVERVLLWTPRSKGRPRAHLIGGKAVMFTPRETVAAERALAEQWGTVPFEGPIEVTLVLHDDHIDVSISETDLCANTKIRRGDIDNYTKLILDSLNGRAWLDDKQIMRLRVVKS